MPSDFRQSRNQMRKHENYRFEEFKRFSESKSKPFKGFQPKERLLSSTESQEIIIPILNLTRANSWFFLLTLNLLINVLQASQTSKETTDSENLISADISFPSSTDHVTYSVKKPSHVKKKVCNSTLDLGKPVKLLCSDDAKKIYKKDKSLWTKNRKFLKDHLENLKDEPLNQCKMLSLAGQLNAIRFFTPSEWSYSIGSEEMLTLGQYDYVNNELKLSTNLISSPDFFNTKTRHELHHGHIAAQHQKAKRADGKAFPFSNKMQLNEIKKAFSNGENRVNKLLLLLDNSNFNHPDVIRLNKFSINYKPSIIDFCFKLNYVELLINKGYIDKQLNILRPVTLDPSNSNNPYGLKLFLKKITKLTDSGQLYLFVCNSVENPQEKMRAVLYDSLYFLRKTEHLYGHAHEYIQVMEKDAHINEQLSHYPQLFQLLYHELYQYHLQFGDQAYRDCVTSSLSARP